jgi:hypothetical protein
MYARQLVALSIALSITSSLASPALAQDNAAFSPAIGVSTEAAWHGELMPYIWAAAVSGDLTVKSQTVTINESFSDLWKYTNLAGSLLGSASYNHFAAFGEADYFSYSTSALNDPPAVGEATLKMYIYEASAGYRFDGDNDRHYDLMAGFRTMSLHGIITLNMTPEFYASNTRNVTDGIIMFRSYIPLSANWSFSPSIDIGGGQSQLTYELWPQFQFKLAEHWALRLGYRTLYYRMSNDNNEMWHGKFDGVMIGIGGIW